MPECIWGAFKEVYLWLGRRQCDQMICLFLQKLAIYNENLLQGIPNQFANTSS